MREYTTFTLTPTLRYKEDNRIADDLVFDYLIFTYRNGCYEINKRVEREAVVDGKFTVSFTQEETSKLNTKEPAEMEVNFCFNNTDDRFASDILSRRIDRNLLKKVIKHE